MSRTRAFNKIVTGGQTGVDRAVLDICLAHSISYGGWCPKGRVAEDGVIDARYELDETPSEDVAVRTEWNARDSDGTLILAYGELTGGTDWTKVCADRYGKPTFVVDMRGEGDIDGFEAWCRSHQIATLNVAGPRESHAPGEIYRLATAMLTYLFRL